MHSWQQHGRAGGRACLERTLRLALIYPALVLVFMLGLLIFFGFVIVPTYELITHPVMRSALSMPRGFMPPQPSQPTLSITTFPAMRLSIWMATPWGIAIDSQRRIRVADTGNHRIVELKL